MTLSRRGFLEGSVFVGSGLALSSRLAWRAGIAQAADAPVRGGQLLFGVASEPAVLTSALTTAGPTQVISGKIFDGLVYYDLNGQPQPQLAKEWSVSPDGLTLTFHLRDGVRWHDGRPFTSADVAYSVLAIWKKYNSRGRSTFANVVAVETPDPLTAIWRLSKPAPYLLRALASVESQVIPRHLYDGTDVLTNPHNQAPIGTGPFRFAQWERGSYIALERNPDYWDQPKPFLDRIIFRSFPDDLGRTTALETGEIQLADIVPYSELGRLAKVPTLKLAEAGAMLVTLSAFEFNLDRPYFKDVRVRQAFAHAIDRDFILRNIWYGYGSVADAPIPPQLGNFRSGAIPAYPFDLAKAADLLDQAGLKPDADGVRLSITHDALPNGQQYAQEAEYIRDSLAKIGVKMTLRSQDFAAFVRRLYTQRDFDTFSFAASAGPDPAIGTQRFYWSKNFQPGVAFSNGSHYANPEVDRLLEAAQTEPDPLKRRDLYGRFQQIAQTELPRLPLLWLQLMYASSVRLGGIDATSYGIYENFATAYLLPESG